ncbi:MAG: aconitate hydratase AcnA [Chlamydiota bacterium]|nr:aconitate hydratase AcnA [Chlamydiota bacterium]
MSQVDTFGTYAQMQFNGECYHYYSLERLEKQGYDIQRLPYSLKILLENLLRKEDGLAVCPEDIRCLAKWTQEPPADKEISFSPARVLMQDFTGVPAVVDLAAMRDAMIDLHGDPSKINPLLPAELVIDHSVQVAHYGSKEALGLNEKQEFKRNIERYAFLRWAQNVFNNFKVVPPDTGIVHQINLEYLSRVVFKQSQTGGDLIYPDTLVGTDSHTTMINGLGVLGWGVGGIEAEAAMLGQPISMLIPQVVGLKLTGALPEGVNATDLVLTVTQLLRKKGVVGKFVEFYGKGLSYLTLADRATLSNMSPEYGSTCAIFPVDAQTIRYLRLSGRDEKQVELIQTYTKAQGLYRTDETPDPIYTDTIELDLSTIEPSIAGPKRPQDRIRLKDAKKTFIDTISSIYSKSQTSKDIKADGKKVRVQDGTVVIAAITSCTNTSNPDVMISAGLLAKKAVLKGLKTNPAVKTSLAPGSMVVTGYLEKSGLLGYLEQLGFFVVGYGCTTCIGNSGPLQPVIRDAIRDKGLVAVSVLSGNRNFEGRIHPEVKANYLASPPLVVAYALAGRMDIDLTQEAIGLDQEGKDVFLKDIWPSGEEIQSVMLKVLEPDLFSKEYANVFKGSESWQSLQIPKGVHFNWDKASTYVRKPTFFDKLELEPSAPKDIVNARALLVLGDSVTTDHISPAGSIPPASPAGQYLIEQGVKPEDFNSYGSRRGNHEVMIRGTFANIRIRNHMVEGVEGGWTRYHPDAQQMTVYAAAMCYQKESVPLIVLAGKEYGSGSSRDWAAKGTMLLGIKAVIAESYERIHRSNLVGMGVLPLEFLSGESWKGLELEGDELYQIHGVKDHIKVGKILDVSLRRADGATAKFQVRLRIDTPLELEYYRHGGILQYVLRDLLKSGTISVK